MRYKYGFSVNLSIGPVKGCVVQALVKTYPTMVPARNIKCDIPTG